MNLNWVFVSFLVVWSGLSIGLWKAFEKAGVAGWKALVPVYSTYCLIEIVGKPKWWIVFIFIPVVDVFVSYILVFDLLRCLGKNSVWSQIIVVFAGFIYIPYLAFKSDVKYIGKLHELPVINKTPVQEWTDAIVFAVVAATLIRWLIMEAYTIPTPSMENSLLVGDFLFVSKFHYGTRTPKTPLQLPLTHQKIWFTEIPSYLPWIELPSYRLPGISEVKREDVVVFNVPPRELNDYKDYPTDLKTNYIKRCVGIPGDRLEVKEKQLIVNGQALKNPEMMKFKYLVSSKDVISERNLNKLDLDPDDFELLGQDATKVVYEMFLTKGQVEELKALPYVSEVVEDYRTHAGPDPRIFPQSKYAAWNGDNFGPIVIPKKGMSIAVNDSTLAFYGEMIRLYDDKANAEVKEGKLFIGGKAVTEYTFHQNYYFMMGDNRHNSLDSRYWGFVPEDHIVGKGFFIWLSIDKYGDMLHKIRWSRFFKMIN